jgi:hypothetical protein
MLRRVRLRGLIGIVARSPHAYVEVWRGDFTVVDTADVCKYLSWVGITSSRGVIGAVSSRTQAFRNLELSVCRSMFGVETPCVACQVSEHANLVLRVTSRSSDERNLCTRSGFIVVWFEFD